MIGISAAIRSTVSRARQLAKSRVQVLLTGETGVGKEVFARGIHEAQSDPGAPFVALNCGGFSRELLNSELFGHAEGSFTGSKRGGMIGKIEAANGGTLFLDEIGEMPMDLQPNFLRVLEQGEVYRLGENKPRKVSFRLVAATHRDLRKEIRDDNFRMDLFYRIAVTSIHIPPLRERQEDVPLLFQHYVKQLSKQHGLGVKEVRPGVSERLATVWMAGQCARVTQRRRKHAADRAWLCHHRRGFATGIAADGARDGATLRRRRRLAGA